MLGEGTLLDETGRPWPSFGSFPRSWPMRLTAWSAAFCSKGVPKRKLDPYLWRRLQLYRFCDAHALWLQQTREGFDSDKYNYTGSSGADTRMGPKR